MGVAPNSGPLGLAGGQGFGVQGQRLQISPRYRSFASKIQTELRVCCDGMDGLIAEGASAGQVG